MTTRDPRTIQDASDYFWKLSGSNLFVLADTGGHHPYVTWMENTQTGGFFWGHYFATLKEAEQDFRKRYADVARVSANICVVED